MILKLSHPVLKTPTASSVYTDFLHINKSITGLEFFKFKKTRTIYLISRVYLSWARDRADLRHVKES